MIRNIQILTLSLVVLFSHAQSTYNSVISSVDPSLYDRYVLVYPPFELLDVHQVKTISNIRIGEHVFTDLYISSGNALMISPDRFFSRASRSSGEAIVLLSLTDDPQMVCIGPYLSLLGFSKGILSVVVETDDGDFSYIARLTGDWGIQDEASVTGWVKDR